MHVCIIRVNRHLGAAIFITALLVRSAINKPSRSLRRPPARSLARSLARALGLPLFTLMSYYTAFEA
jgi:hypothetical protein